MLLLLLVQEDGGGGTSEAGGQDGDTLHERAPWNQPTKQGAPDQIGSRKDTKSLEEPHLQYTHTTENKSNSTAVAALVLLA